MNSRWLTNCSRRRAWSSTISPTLSAKHFGDRTRKPTSLPKSFPFWKMQRNPKRRTLSKASENKVHLFPKRNCENEKVCSPKIYFFCWNIKLKTFKVISQIFIFFERSKMISLKILFNLIVRSVKNNYSEKSEHLFCRFTLKGISVETKNNNFFEKQKAKYSFWRKQRKAK